LNTPYQAERLKSWLELINNNSSFKHLKKFIIKEEALNDKNQKPKAVKKEKHCMTLLVKYTDKEMASIARKFSEADTERDNIAKRKATAMAGYKADQEIQQEAIDKIKEKIRKGGAMGTVECKSSLDEKSRIIETIRLDTGEIVEGVGHPVMNLKDKKKDTSKKDKEVENLIKWYEKAKEEKDSSSMIKILEDLEKKGVIMEAGKDGPKWIKKDVQDDDGSKALIKDLEAAKKANNLSLVGKLKKQLEMKGYLPEDSKDGVKWVKKNK
jgi:cysteinyl-tRNA synthetase